MGRLAASGTPTVVVSVGVPYDVAHLPATVTQFAAYSSAAPGAGAIARLLTGDLRASGVMPVGIR